MTKRTPRERRVARLAWVAGACHMRRFMAGATSTGQPNARSVVESASSAIPAAILAITLAVAGTTTASSAKSASSTWGIGPSPEP